MSTEGNSQPSSPDLVDVLKQIEEHLAALRRDHDKSLGDWLTVEEAAKELKLSRDTIERLIHSGRLKAAAISPKGSGRRNHYRIYRDWLKDYLAEKAKEVVPEPVRKQRHRRARIRISKDYFPDSAAGRSPFGPG